MVATRRQQESRLLGFIVGAIASFTLVLVGSLLPWFDDSDPADTAQPVAAAGVDDAGAGTTTGDTTTQGTTAQGSGAQGARSPGQGGGPPEGRGPGSQNNSDANADPLSFGRASQEVQDAFTAGGCVACHSIKGIGGGNATIGPHLFRLGVIAADRRPGSSAAAYIEESILNPNAFIMPNCPTGPCPSGVMPQAYAETLSPAQIETIVNYLAVLGTAAESDVLNPPSG
jgi:mono/diheme cytochrome c family protein